MTSSPRIAVLANPDRDQLNEEFLAAMSGDDVVELAPDGPADIGASVAEAVSDGVDVVAAIGGDGTQRSVAAELANTSTALGVVPGGTVNLLAQVLEIDDVAAAVRAIRSGRRRSIDIGRCNDDRFVLNASSGYDADVIAAADDGNKARFGRLTFARAAVTRFWKTRPIGVEVIVDGVRAYDGAATSVIVTNVAERSSADFRVAPDAEFDDGRLDVLVVRAASARAGLRLVWRLARDRDPDPADLVRASGAEIEVRWKQPVAGQIDGDAIERAARFVHRVEPGALHVCV